MSERTARALRWVSPAIGLALFAAAVVVLHRELRSVRLDEVRATLGALPPSAFLLSLALCAVNYGILTGFDLLAFRYIGRKVTSWKVAVVSFTGYAVSNSVGFALISGTSVRYRFYSRWGLTAGDISRIVVFYMGTYLVGLLVLGGYTLAFDPPPGIESLPGGRFVALAGWALMGSAALYLVASAVRRRPFRLRGVEVSLPPFPVVVGQLVLSSLDWAFGAAIFYVLLPPEAGLDFATFLSAFMAAQVVAILSHVPGGVGVFEGTMTIFLHGWLRPEQLLAALVLYRLVYYLIPLGGALCILLVDELRQRRHVLSRWGTFGGLSDQVAPKVLGAFVFLAGAVLLVAGAIPTERETLAWLRNLPLAAVEAAYVAGSVLGTMLLVSAHGVARRLRRSWAPTLAALLLGNAALFLSGGDTRVVAFVGLVTLAVLAARGILERREGFWDAKFSPLFLAGIAVVVGASFWVGSYAFRRADTLDASWLSFAVEQDFPRFLRASAAAGAALLAFVVARLLRPPAPAERAPAREELEAAGRVVAAQGDTLPFLVFLRDKALLFSPARSAFLMYAVHRGTWVVLGDPVGEPAAATALLRRFLERCDDYGGVPVFYQATPAWLERYADFGLTSVKLGDEALVPLRSFAPEGPGREEFRDVLERAARGGLRFRVVPPEEVPALLPALRSVSDAWLERRGGDGEKGFSVGFFDAEYLVRFPVALVEDEEGVAGFATVWPGPGGEELGVDLLRYRPDAPGEAVEALLLHLMQWGRERGYARFSLGTAPLPDLEISAVAPAWTRIGYYLLHRGEAAEEHDRYERLRAYKERFGPEWEERFLVYPGGFPLPRVTADVTSLIEGGYREILGRE